MPRLFDLPYIPNRKGIQQRHRNLSKYRMLHRFAYTETMSGLKDDIPTLLFYAPFALLKDTCEYLCRMMAGSVEDMIITPSHSCRRKNGKIYWRQEVQIIGLDTDFLSMESLSQMIVHRMETICNCKVRRYRLETFLNL